MWSMSRQRADRRLEPKVDAWAPTASGLVSSVPAGAAVRVPLDPVRSPSKLRTTSGDLLSLARILTLVKIPRSESSSSVVGTLGGLGHFDRRGSSACRTPGHARYAGDLGIAIGGLSFGNFMLRFLGRPARLSQVPESVHPPPPTSEQVAH